MEKGRFGNGFDVGLEREGGVQDDAQVTDFGGWRDGTAIDLEKELPDLPELCLGPHDHELCFFAVKFEEVGGHPDFYCLEAVDYGLGGEQRGWCGAEIQLCIISIAVVA